MKRFSFYHKETGVFATHWYGASAPELKVNTPPDHVPLEGVYHPFAHRFDLTTGMVVRAEAPEGHEWDEAQQRWMPDAAARERLRMQSEYRLRAAELHDEERKLVRAALLGDTSARARLEAIERELKALEPPTGT